MVTLADLWLPIVLSAAAVWIASALAWMVMPHHKGEFKGVPDEDAFLAAMRSAHVPPGQYMFPFCKDPNAIKTDPALKAKFDAGPWGTMNVIANKWGNMGGKMAGSFIFYLVVSALAAHLATIAFPRNVAGGADFAHVFHFTSIVAVMAYCLASIPQAIWFNKPLGSVIAGLVDGIAFGIITGAIFAWRWPGM